MKTIVYSKRNFKELMSDPLSLIFTLGLPAFLLVFMVMLNKNLEINDAFKVENFVPSSIIFSFAFLTMFSGMLIAKDRSSAFLTRMFISPLKPFQYILGYIIPLLIMALIQIVIIYTIGFIVGLSFTINVVMSILFLLLVALLFIGFGLLLGSLLKDQQVGPVSSILIQVVAFLSGMWFSLDLVGGAFKAIGYMLPFAHSVDMIRLILQGKYSEILFNLLIVSIYVLLSVIAAIFSFKKNMKE